MYVKFKYQVYSDSSNGYCVCQYRNIEDGSKITCVGNNLPTLKNLTYEFTTEEYMTPKYGKSYKVLAWTEYITKEKEDIIEYLSCGLFSGISKKIAENIYDSFGNDTIDILDNDIDKLLSVKGIGSKTLIKIKKSYIEKRASREIADRLLRYDVSINTINRIYNEYKSSAIEIIENEPYSLCKIRGITFPIADKIADDLGFKKNSYERIKAASNHILIEDMVTGSVCMEKKDYAIKLIRLLDTELITTQNICEYVIRMIKDGTVRYSRRTNTEYIYYPSTYNAERKVAETIRLLIKKRKKTVNNIDALIDMFKGDIELDETQREAIKIGVEEPIFIITGGPGTGKTTIIKIIAMINEYLNNDIDNNVFLAPTGRAARRISESTGYSASTIHSKIGLDIIDDQKYIDDIDGRNEEMLKDSRVIIDEASMIDLWTMAGLLRNLGNSTLGLIGDTNQLPSVGCGSILRDLIDCGRIACIELEHIHRQADDAKNICINAQNIKNGNSILKEGTDFFFEQIESMESLEDRIVDETLNEIIKYGVENVKCLCPFKKGYAGVYRVNSLIQEHVNPLKGRTEIKTLNDMSFRVDDPVMQLRNDEDVANGDVGFISSITSDTITVIFSENKKNIEKDYTYSEAKEQLMLAYAITVHKSQGSEYDSVVMCLTDKHGIMKKRNILYTGITRGKHHVTLLGQQSAIDDAVSNKMTEDRHSVLAELIAMGNNIIKYKKPQEDYYKQLKLPI